MHAMQYIASHVVHMRVFIPRHNGKLVYQSLHLVPGVSVSIRGTHATSDSHLTPAHTHTPDLCQLQYLLTVTMPCSTKLVKCDRWVNSNKRHHFSVCYAIVRETPALMWPALGPKTTRPKTVKTTPRPITTRLQAWSFQELEFWFQDLILHFAVSVLVLIPESLSCGLGFHSVGLGLEKVNPKPQLCEAKTKTTADHGVSMEISPGPSYPMGPLGPG